MPGTVSLTGKTISHYRILEMLGGGGMGGTQTLSGLGAPGEGFPGL